MPERIEDLRGPPVVGRLYEVTTVAARWLHWKREWVVLGPRHRDLDYFPDVPRHYHFDFRFMPAELFERFANWVGRDITSAAVLAGSPYSDLGPETRRIRKCRRELPAYNMHDNPIIGRIRRDYAGRQAPSDGAGGWLCPHRRLPLAGLPVESDGAVTCPLHGLRICAGSGRVLPGPPEPRVTVLDQELREFRPAEAKENSHG